jgi:hypothetical protein
MLGHELRNLLAPIVTAPNLMKLRGVTGAERERSVIARQVAHLTRLVDEHLVKPITLELVLSAISR